MKVCKRLFEKLASGQTHLNMVKKGGKTVLMSDPTSIPLESFKAPIPTKRITVPPSTTVLLNKFEKNHVKKASNGGTF